MRGYVANTDYDWFTFLRSIEPPIEEVNFWKPGADVRFRTLTPGEPIFFKLKKPHHAIAGFGSFAHYSALPVSMAWSVYGEGNGARTFPEMRARLEMLRRRHQMASDPKQEFWIGCILVHQPVFFDEANWVKVPSDWARNIVGGKSYDLRSGEGERLWIDCVARAATLDRLPLSASERIADSPLGGGFGAPALVEPRLGQRSFRVAVLDSYERRCAITRERTLPALEAAHIRDYAAAPVHRLSNGILFRADVHKLFDAGYVTVTPEYRFEVSGRIREEFENGRDYYQLHGTPIRVPANPAHRPSLDALAWHNGERFRG